MLTGNPVPLRLALLRGARVATQGMARFARPGGRPAPRENDDPTQRWRQDAGWVQMLDATGQRPRGRGRLMLRSEGARGGDTPALDARLVSFVPAQESALATAIVCCSS